MRLEIGPGPEKLGDDWATVSAFPGESVDFMAEWGLDDLPFPDEQFDEVYAAHVIEHVGWMQVEGALMEAWRVLKPGGLIELHTIDAGRLLRDLSLAADGPIRDRLLGVGHGRWEHPMQAVNYQLFSYAHQVGDRACFQWHHGCFTEEYLGWLLARCGFEQVQAGGTPRGPEKHGAYNLGMRAVKK